MSRGDLKASRWLDAFSERCTGLRATPGTAALADLSGDGHRCLVAADVPEDASEGRGRMRVYKGTTALDISLPDAPSALVAFYTDHLEPRIPAIAVACGSNLYIYKNNKPFYKFRMPTMPVSAEEIKCWKDFFDADVAGDNVKKLLDGLSTFSYSMLSTKSQEILSTNPNKIEELLRKLDSENFFDKQLYRESPIVCMTTLKKTTNDRYEVFCPVVATESGNVVILDPQTFAVIQQVNTYRTKMTPCVIRASGIFNVEYRIVIACREGYVCLLRRSWLEGKALIQMISNIVDLVVIPDENFIVVATTDKMLSCFTKKGSKLWKHQMTHHITCLNLVHLQHIGTTLVAIGLRNGIIQLFNGRKLCDQTVVPGIPSVITFGQLGQEEHVLVIITIDGTVLFRILKRTAEFHLNEIDILPLFQSKPLPLPKRSKLFLEQSQREKNTAQDMHKGFQQDLTQFRHNVALEMLKQNSTQSDLMSQKDQIKLSAQVLGLGPKFKVVFTLDNMETEKVMVGLSMILHVNPTIYACSKNRILIPMIQPGLSCKLTVNIEEVINENRDMSDLPSWSTIRVFVVKEVEREELPILVAATINMPPAEYIF